MPTRKKDQPADPDKLVREEAGSYRTADERFQAREADGGWFLVDTTQTNEFGQELMHGPFATLKAVREAIPSARERKAAAKPPPTRKKKPAEPSRAKPAPPPSWIDELPKAEATRVRLLVRALEGAGIPDAEALVRKDHEGLFPTIARTLIEARLDALVDELPEKERDRARTLVRRAAEVLSAGGSSLPEPLPGWSLVEIGPEPAPKNRRIGLGE